MKNSFSKWLSKHPAFFAETTDAEFLSRVQITQPTGQADRLSRNATFICRHPHPTVDFSLPSFLFVQIFGLSAIRRIRNLLFLSKAQYERAWHMRGQPKGLPVDYSFGLPVVRQGDICPVSNKPSKAVVYLHTVTCLLHKLLPTEAKLPCPSSPPELVPFACWSMPQVRNKLDPFPLVC
uniref:Uncharacterized protein n=1 Tax=Sphaerodactylus townsendi TaxID=933632 RepID=A0ACB8G688_9SAUR